MKIIYPITNEQTVALCMLTFCEALYNEQ